MSNSDIDRALIYSCLPISRSRLYESDFIYSLTQLTSSHTTKSPKAKTEKSIDFLEENITTTPRFRRPVFSKSTKSTKTTK
ncbi:MAG: hypothetical protein EB120_05085 [Proteobacteria bacterium]|nr:hypothetical protein [Pseudomonadota bacterium]